MLGRRKSRFGVQGEIQFQKFLNSWLGGGALVFRLVADEEPFESLKR